MNLNTDHGARAAARLLGAALLCLLLLSGLHVMTVRAATEQPAASRAPLAQTPDPLAVATPVVGEDFTYSLPSGARLVFSDTFGDPNSGLTPSAFDTQTGKYYGPGGYHMAVVVPNSSVIDGWAPVYRDFAVRVRVTPLTHDDGFGAGLVFRRNGDNMYTFIVRQDGNYRLRITVDGASTDVIGVAGVSSSNFINKGLAANELAVTANGPSIYLFVNGHQVESLYLETERDNALPAGQVGLWAGTARQGGSSVVFTEAQIWDLSFVRALPDSVEFEGHDSFDDPSSGLIDGEHLPDRERFYGGGRYHIIAHEANTGWLTVWPRSVQNFAFEAEVIPLTPDDTAMAGIVFRYLNESNHYQFVVRQDGAYALSRFQDRADATLLDWQTSEFINPGTQSNRLGIVADGSQLSMYANGHLLGTAQDDALQEGKAGLLARAGDQPDSHVTFADAYFWTLPGPSPWQRVLAVAGSVLTILLVLGLAYREQILAYLFPNRYGATAMGMPVIPVTDGRTSLGELYERADPSAAATTGGTASLQSVPGADTVPRPVEIHMGGTKSVADKPTLDRNPYIVGPPVDDPTLFYGREDVFDYVRKELAAARGNLTLVIYGGRRTGKTSVLLQIRNGRLGSQVIPVYVDMQVMAEVDAREFFSKIGQGIAIALPDDPVQAALAHLQDRTQNAYTAFQALLATASRAAGQRILLLAVDEYEILERLVDAGRLSVDVFPYLKGLMEQPMRFAFLFTGSRPLEELRGAYWDWARTFSPAQYKRISFLTEADTRRLIIEPVRPAITYENAAVDAILRLAAGHPYFTQGICRGVVDSLIAEKRTLVTVGDVNDAVDDIVQNPLPHMIFVWNELEPDQKLVLSGLGTYLVDAEAWARPVELSAALLTYQVAMAETQVAPLLVVLSRQELLVVREGAYQFRIDLLRHWIAEEHSIWQTRAEVRPPSGGGAA